MQSENKSQMISILGLAVIQVTDQEKNQISDLINQRNMLRGQKKFQEADAIRKQISEDINTGTGSNPSDRPRKKPDFRFDKSKKHVAGPEKIPRGRCNQKTNL